MPRPVWKGAISFGLVNVPVDLYPAESRDALRFRQLDRTTLTPVKEHRINEQTGREVVWDDIVKGYEYAPERFVVLNDEELETADPRATHTIEIQGFVLAEEIDPRYFDRPYYLGPAAGGEKGYALLREALRRSGRVAVAKVVLRSKEYLAAVLPFGTMLVLELMRYAHELRAADAVDVPGDDLEALGIKERELALADQLIAAMVEPWRPEQYHDAFRDDVLALIERKVAAGALSEPLPATPSATDGGEAEIIDIMSLLKESVARQRRERMADESAAGHDPSAPAAER